MLKKVLQKSLKNYIFSIISIVAITSLGFIGTPIIIRYIGKSEYGVYQLILQFLGHLAICDLGLSTSSCDLLSQAWNKHDRKYVIRTIKLLLKQYLVTIPVLILAIVTISYIFLNFSLKSYDRDILLSFIMMASCSFILPLNVFNDFLKASENSHLISKITTIQLLFMTLLNITFCYWGLGIIGLAISYTGMILLFRLIICLISFRKITKIPIKDLEFNLEVKSIWTLNFHSFIQHLLGKLSFATDTIILSFFAPVAAITNFVTNQKLATLVGAITLSIGNSSWASIATLQDSKQELQKGVDFINKFILILCLPALFSLASNNHDFISLWLGEDFYISNMFTWVAFGNYTIFGIISFWGWIFVSLGKFHLQTKTIFISGIINISCSLILTKYLGEIGPVLGTFISFYGFYVWHLRYIMKKDLGIDVSGFLFLLSILIVVFSSFFPFLEYIKFFDGKSWVTLLANISVSFSLSLTICLSILLKKEDLLYFSNMLKDKHP